MAMKVQVYPDTQSAGRAAAREVASLLKRKPHACLGMATGHTMIPVFGEMVRMHEEMGLSFKEARTFNLDEYVGLGKDMKDSYHEFMMNRLVRQIDVAEENFHIPNGLAKDLAAECERYEKTIKESGGIDLQLLGLGRNGHIGFNEPGSPKESRTRVIDLSPQTRDINAGDFREETGTPERAITVGIATILEAWRIVLVVTGWEKAEILDKVLTTTPTVDIPATFLHTHPDVTLVSDLEAMEVYVTRQKDKALKMEVDPTAQTA